MTKEDVSKDELFADADRLLAAMDFQAVATRKDLEHQRELSRLLLQFLEILDSLETLEEHCTGQVAWDSVPRTGQGLGTESQATVTGLADDNRGLFPARSVSLLRRKMLQIFSEVGVTPMNAVGHKLDLQRHEVVGARLDPGRDEDTVVEEQLRGYLWNSQVLRIAKVIVAGPPLNR
jgi:molecular chaperone GrpE (heat shock protein)